MTSGSREQRNKAMSFAQLKISEIALTRALLCTPLMVSRASFCQGVFTRPRPLPDVLRKMAAPSAVRLRPPLQTYTQPHRPECSQLSWHSLLKPLSLPMLHGRGGFMRTVRVFVSSPGDAANERKRVVRVIEKLNAAFAGSVVIEPVLWEDRFYSAHDGFQPQIARSADCDIVIAILRARLGTPFASRLRGTSAAGRACGRQGRLSERHGL
jgi:Domain of unknown function (DUF4062)